VENERRNIRGDSIKSALSALLNSTYLSDHHRTPPIRYCHQVLRFVCEELVGRARNGEIGFRVVVVVQNEKAAGLKARIEKLQARYRWGKKIEIEHHESEALVFKTVDRVGEIPRPEDHVFRASHSLLDIKEAGIAKPLVGINLKVVFRKSLKRIEEIQLSIWQRPMNKVAEISFVDTDLGKASWYPLPNRFECKSKSSVSYRISGGLYGAAEHITVGRKLHLRQTGQNLASQLPDPV